MASRSATSASRAATSASRAASCAFRCAFSRSHSAARRSASYRWIGTQEVDRQGQAGFTLVAARGMIRGGTVRLLAAQAYNCGHLQIQPYTHT